MTVWFLLLACLLILADNLMLRSELKRMRKERNRAISVERMK